MAKFGEGDPRWLVQDRADGTNVNNWHWSEKDCLEWSRHRLKELFDSLSLLPSEGPASITVSGPPEVTGEALINIRKAKMIPSYELCIAIPWSGKVLDGSGMVAGTATGKVHLPYVADENHDELPELRIAAETEDAAAQRLKQTFNSSGKKIVQDKVAQFIKELRAGGPASKPDTVAPSGSTAGGGAMAASGAPPVKLTSAKPEDVRKPVVTKAGSSKGQHSSLTLTQRFFARTADIHECFTSAQRIMAYTMSPATSDPKPGGAFTLFGGSVTGSFVEISPSKIVQKWRFSTWEDGVFSKVTIDLAEPEPGNTILTLTQTDIPDTDRFGNEDVRDNVEKGWQGQILTRIRSVFGYGV